MPAEVASPAGRDDISSEQKHVRTIKLRAWYVIHVIMSVIIM